MKKQNISTSPFWEKGVPFFLKCQNWHLRFCRRRILNIINILLLCLYSLPLKKQWQHPITWNPTPGVIKFEIQVNCQKFPSLPSRRGWESQDSILHSICEKNMLFKAYQLQKRPKSKNYFLYEWQMWPWKSIILLYKMK